MTRPFAPAVLLPVAAGVVVFLANNLLLATVLTGLPGGTVLAATDLAAVAFVARVVRRPGVVTLIYASYAFLGFLGHLAVDPLTYLTGLPRVLLASLAFDAVLHAGRYRPSSLALGLVPFAGILLLDLATADFLSWLAALAMAFTGLVAGLLLESGWARARRAGGGAPRDGRPPQAS